MIIIPTKLRNKKIITEEFRIWTRNLNKRFHINCSVRDEGLGTLVSVNILNAAEIFELEKT